MRVGLRIAECNIVLFRKNDPGSHTVAVFFYGVSRTKDELHRGTSGSSGFDIFQDHIKEGLIELVKIPTEKIASDHFTKPVQGARKLWGTNEQLLRDNFY
jgi:hypothetical protein